jgi:hypothetical protein
MVFYCGDLPQLTSSYDSASTEDEGTDRPEGKANDVRGYEYCMMAELQRAENDQVRDAFPHYAPTSLSWSHSKEDTGSSLSPGLLVADVHHDLPSLMSRLRRQPQIVSQLNRHTTRLQAMVPTPCRSQLPSLPSLVTRPTQERRASPRPMNRGMVRALGKEV